MNYEPCDKCNRRAVTEVKYGMGVGLYCREHGDEAQADKLARLQRLLRSGRR